MPHKNLDDGEAYRLAYRLENWERIQAYRRTPVKCECGAILTRHHYRSHKKTQKHMDAMKEEAPFSS